MLASFYFLGLYTPLTSSNLHKPNTSTFIPNINHLRDLARWGTNSEMQRFAVWTHHAEEEAERIRCQGSAQVCPGRCRHQQNPQILIIYPLVIYHSYGKWRIC